MKISAQTPKPATIEVVRNAFISGAEQMRRNLYRSSFSPVIYEMKDCSVGIYDSEGSIVSTRDIFFWHNKLTKNYNNLLKWHTHWDSNPKPHHPHYLH